MASAGRDAQVIVVGAGPAGSATATLLAERGIDVLMVERADFPREKPCGEYLSPGVIDLLDRLGAAPAVLAQPHGEPLGMRIRSRDGEFLLRYRDQGIDRRAVGIARPLLDQALLERAVELGARVEHRLRVTGPLIDEGRVVGVEGVRGGARSRLRSEVVVIADGLHSTTARALGLERPIRWPLRLGLIARYRVPPGSFPVAEMHVGRDSYCGLNPVGPDLLNVGLVCRMGHKQPGEPIERFFERALSELPGAEARLAEGKRVTAITGRGPLARRVRRVAGPGFLLVGDAAGFLDPFTGEGVYRAVKGAFLASAAIEGALVRPDRFPAGYAWARRRAFGSKELVCLLIQAFLQSEALFDRVVQRLPARPATADAVSAVLGDLRPAGAALHPRILWSLVAP